MRIAGDSSAGGVVSSRSSALSLKQVQTYLAVLGYRPGLADGVMGRNTLIALKEFQRDYSLEETGQPDQETSAVLQEQYTRRQ
jgi:peptidoglycan hydrolase-like protein with peptidoglycan-binding domain